MEGWISTELGSIDFNDKRLKKRCMKIVEQISARPSATIPEACLTWADIKGAYRFFSSESVTPEKIRASHINSTITRIKQHETILAIQDTTNLDYSDHESTEGLGELDNKCMRGLKVHSCLAATITGVPQGLLYQQTWARDSIRPGRETRHTRSTEEKESLRWITTLKAVETVVPETIHTIVIGDRESDMYDLFATPRRPGLDLLVRAQVKDRRVNSKEGNLLETIQKSSLKGQITVELKRGDEHSARKAILDIKYQEIEILPPKRRMNNPNLKPIRLYAILAEETEPPKGQIGVDWLLLTTIEIKSLEDAVTVIQWYTRRWLIERYHYSLKSGCRVEDLQLETAERLERALATYCIVAWRLLWLTYKSRETPDAPCTEILETYEWKSLYYFINKGKNVPLEPPSIKEAIVSIAKLGGFIGRKGDKDPGVKTIWQGLHCLDGISRMWLTMECEKRCG